MSRLALLLAVLGLALLAGCIGADEAGAGEAETRRSPADDADGEASTEDGNATPPSADAPHHDPGWPDKDEAAIRPGVRIAGGSCTSNYVFSSPDNRTLYLGTAGHCVPDASPGDDVPVAGGAYNGTLAFAANRDDPHMDFALVALPDAARDEVHPAVLHYGGPTGLAADPSQGDRVLTFGNTTYREHPGVDRLDPREGYLSEHAERRSEVYLEASSVFGDSGSPILLGDGQALGLVYGGAIGVGGSSPCVSCNTVTNLDAAMAAAAEAGVPVELKTWELMVDPSIPKGP